jgi:CubicO group peptidase (beta-lactamase class C family)
MRPLARALVVVSFAALCARAPAQPADTPWPDAGWQRAQPEEVGMDSGALAALVDYGANAQMDSLFVVRRGKAVAEVYYAPFQPGMKHRINSATKGVVGALAGIAAGKGLLGSTDMPVLELFADRHAANVDARKKQMTLQHLLDMQSGLAWSEPLAAVQPETVMEMGRSHDWVQFVLDRPMALPPGGAFDYNSGNSQLVSAIIARKTGMDTQAFAVRELFTPLGIMDFRWRKDPQGIPIGGFGLYLRTPDMAKIGWLYLNRGEWKGAQLVPREWVDKVFEAQVPMTPGGAFRYADFWWTIPARQAYMAVGFNRQIIMVLPDVGVVAAMTGRMNYPIENVVDHLRRAVKSDSPLPANAEAAALLGTRIAQAGVEKAAEPSPAPPIAREISGKTYEFARNERGWKELTLHFGNPGTYELVTYTSRTAPTTRRVSRPVGMEGRFLSTTSENPVVSSKAAWIDDNTLMLTARLPEEALTETYRVRFSGRRIEITLTDPAGNAQTLTGEMAY